MNWNYVYLVIGVVSLIAAVWRLARGSHLLLPIIGMLWFLVVLLQFFIPDAYRFVMIQGMPSIGRLIHYVAIPVCIILVLLQRSGRRL
jgi:hypothetical protein